MKAIALDRPRNLLNVSSFWESCEPFVENRRGTLIHRPRSVAVYKIHKHPHLAAVMWCGMSLTDSDGHLDFIDSPPVDGLVCRVCEARAVIAGMPSSFEITGRHVHVGKMMAVRMCCNEAKP